MKRLVPLDALYRHRIGRLDLQQQQPADGADLDESFLEVIGADLDGAPQGQRCNELCLLNAHLH